MTDRKARGEAAAMESYALAGGYRIHGLEVVREQAPCDLHKIETGDLCEALRDLAKIVGALRVSSRSARGSEKVVCCRLREHEVINHQSINSRTEIAPHCVPGLHYPEVRQEG